MLTQQESKNLISHIVNIFIKLLLPRYSPEGYLFVDDSAGNLIIDTAATHSFVELCVEIDPVVTKYYLDQTCGWFIENQNLVQDPFYISTLALAKKINKSEAKRIVSDLILSNQLSDGYRSRGAYPYSLG